MGLNERAGMRSSRWHMHMAHQLGGLLTTPSTAPDGVADDDAFERLTRIGARALGAPVALVSFLTDDALLEIGTGRPAEQAGWQLVPFERTFCCIVIESGEPLVIGDARADARVSGHPAVREFGALAYLGVPLQAADRQPIGVFCALDHQPREWSADDIATLRDLAELAITEVELRRANARFERAQEAGRTFVYEWDLRSQAVTRSSGVEVVSGYRPEELASDRAGWSALMAPGDIARLTAEGRAQLAGADGYVQEYRIRHRAGHDVWVWDRGTVERDAQGNPVRAFGTTTDITARHAAEQALRASEARLRLALEAGRFGTWSWQVDGDRIEWSDEAALMHGLPAGTRRARFAEIAPRIHPDDRQRVVDLVRGAVASGDGYTLEVRVVWPDDSTHWLEVSARPLIDEDGRVHQLIGLVTDISARKQVEAELEQRRREFETLVEHSPDVIARFDRELRHRYVNRAIERVTGLSPHDYLNRTNAELGFPPDLLALWNERCERAFATGEEQRYEFTFDGVDGVHYYAAHLLPERDAAGEVASLLAITYDVTAARQVERELRASEERFRTLANTIPSIAFVSSPAGAIEFINRYWCEVTGQPEVEALDTGWTALLHPEDVEPILARWNAAVASGEPYEAQCRYRMRDGSYRWHLARALPLRDGDGRITRWLGVSTDIDDHKRLEEERQLFVNAAAHDLRNPLTVIRSQAQLVRRQLERGAPADPARLGARLATIDATAQRAARLIDELLDAARLEAGHPLQLALAPADLVEIARHHVQEQQATTSRHTLLLDAPDTPLTGNWDAERVGRAVDNLIVNAIKFSPDGGPVSVELAREEDAGAGWAVLRVRDEGVGIPASDLPWVFERFRRGTNVTGSFAGSGIGLAGARRIAEQHGGTLTAESREGDGSTFTLRLPLAPGG